MRGMTVLAMLGSLVGCQGKDPHARAKALIAANCGACHTVPGVKGADGRVGPSLAGIGQQKILAGFFPNTPQTMSIWIMHPQKMLPGNAMPETGLNRKQARLVVTYLYTLDKK